jgi:hypothetical protein
MRAQKCELAPEALLQGTPQSEGMSAAAVRWAQAVSLMRAQEGELEEPASL